MTQHLRQLAVAAAAIFLGTVPVTARAQVAPGDSIATQSIRPGDIVRLRIWREPDLSGEFPVDQASFVVLPKLGALSVSAETPQSLADRLADMYRQFLRDPSIEIRVLKRVNILGAVKNPGLYPIDATMTIADAVALAGGATAEGDRRKIELIREGTRVDIQLSERTRVADLPLHSGDQLFVPERSWISRSPAVVAASLSAAASLIVALLLR